MKNHNKKQTQQRYKQTIIKKEIQKQTQKKKKI